MGALGFAKEIGLAAITGDVPVTGAQRQMKEDEIKQMRSQDGRLSSQ